MAQAPPEIAEISPIRLGIRRLETKYRIYEGVMTLKSARNKRPHLSDSSCTRPRSPTREANRILRKIFKYGRLLRARTVRALDALLHGLQGALPRSAWRTARKKKGCNEHPRGPTEVHVVPLIHVVCLGLVTNSYPIKALSGPIMCNFALRRFPLISVFPSGSPSGKRH